MPSEATVGQNTVWRTPARPDLEIEVRVLPPVFVVGEHGDRRRLARLLDGRDGISCAPESELLNDLADAARRRGPTGLRRAGSERCGRRVQQRPLSCGWLRGGRSAGSWPGSR